MNKHDITAMREELSKRYPMMKDECMSMSDEVIKCAMILSSCSADERSLFVDYCEKRLMNEKAR